MSRKFMLNKCPFPRLSAGCSIVSTVNHRVMQGCCVRLIRDHSITKANNRKKSPSRNKIKKSFVKVERISIDDEDCRELRPRAALRSSPRRPNSSEVLGVRRSSRPRKHPQRYLSLTW